MIYRYIIVFLLSSFTSTAQQESTLPVIQVEYDIILNDTTDVESYQRALKHVLVTDGKEVIKPY